MKILVDKSLFGNEKYLLMSENECLWAKNGSISHDLYLDTNKANTLNDYLSLYGINPLVFIDEKYQKMLSTTGARVPNWKNSLPQRVYSSKLESLFSFLKNANQLFVEESYAEVYKAGDYILQKLEGFTPNAAVLGSKIENPTVRNTIKSFTPEPDGVTKKVLYNRFKTVTGRLVVKSGPQVLLLPRSMKNIFKSRYADGSILWIDFVSLEPRFTKLLTSGFTEKDIYTDVIKEYSLTCGREKVKAAILSTLFGAGLAKLTEIVGKEAFIIKKAIDEYFSLDRVLELAGDYTTGKIKNFFGRPISLKKSSSNIAVNNFVQSSSVDIALMGFSSLIKDHRLPKSVKPLGIVHDALIIDVKNSDIDAVYEIINEGISIKNVGHFFLECDII